jgi:hypothetical protein
VPSGKIAETAARRFDFLAMFVDFPSERRFRQDLAGRQ